MTTMRCGALSMLIATAYGHAGLVIPTTRNSIDRLADGFSVDGSALGTPCTCAVSPVRQFDVSTDTATRCLP